MHNPNAHCSPRPRNAWCQNNCRSVKKAAIVVRFPSFRRAELNFADLPTISRPVWAVQFGQMRPRGRR